MRRYIIYKNGEGWLVFNSDGAIVRTTLVLNEATEMPFRVAIRYLGEGLYIIDSPLFQDI